MKKNALLLLGLLALLGPLAHAQLAEGTWLDRTDEKKRLTFENKDGKLWLRLEGGQSYEVKAAPDGPYAQVSRQQVPIKLGPDGKGLIFLRTEYIPIKESRKARFSGLWESVDGDTSFEVAINENNELIWDVISEGQKPVRFWPKRTARGFYFTRGYDDWSFELRDGKLVDSEGTTYTRVAGL